MKSPKTKPAWLILILLAIMTSACQPTGVSQFDQASTYAAQTKMAIPDTAETPEQKSTTVPEATATATAEPTSMPSHTSVLDPLLAIFSGMMVVLIAERSKLIERILSVTSTLVPFSPPKGNHEEMLNKRIRTPARITIKIRNFCKILPTF